MRASDTTPGDTGFTPATATVLVNAAPASALAFTAPPSSVTRVGQPFPPLTALVVDAYGNRIRTGAGSTDTIAVSGPSLACTGGTTAMASSGAATFTGCTLDTPPSATLTGKPTPTPGDTGFTPATTTVTVLRASTHTSLTSSANPGTVGTPVVYTAKVTSTPPSAGTPTGDVEFEEGGSPSPAAPRSPSPPGAPPAP